MTKYNTSKKQDVTIYKIDVGEEKELTRKFKVRTVPALVYLKNGKVIASELGVRTPDEIEANVKKYFK